MLARTEHYERERSTKPRPQEHEGGAAVDSERIGLRFLDLAPALPREVVPGDLRLRRRFPIGASILTNTVEPAADPSTAGEPHDFGVGDDSPVHAIVDAVALLPGAVTELPGEDSPERCERRDVQHDDRVASHEPDRQRGVVAAVDDPLLSPDDFNWAQANSSMGSAFHSSSK